MKALLILAALLPAAAMAESYGTPSGCARNAGGDYHGDGAVVWDRDAGTLEFHESLCDIDSVTQVGSGGIVLGVSCSGEGETWTEWYDLATTMDDKHYILAPQQYPDMETDIYLCE